MRVEAQRSLDDFSSMERNEIARPVFSQETKKSSDEKQKKINMEDLNGKTNKMSKETLDTAVGVINEAMKISNYHLEFKPYEKSGEYQVKVVDSTTDQVIREIPADNVLEFAAQVRSMMDKMIGLLVDEKV